MVQAGMMSMLVMICLILTSDLMNISKNHWTCIGRS